MLNHEPTPKERRVQRVLVEPFKISTAHFLSKRDKSKEKGVYQILDDLTFFMKADDFLSECRRAMGGRRVSGANIFYTQPNLCTVDLAGPVKLPNVDPSPCRIHAALCYGGKYYAVTLRDAPSPNYRTNPLPFTPNREDEIRNAVGNGHWSDLADLLNFDSIKPDRVVPSGSYLTSPYKIADILYPEIFSRNSDAAGLVLVTGGTGSGKTTVLNGLLAKYIASLFGSRALEIRPRVVAVGDPVETSFFRNNVSWWASKDKSLCSADFQAEELHYQKRPIDFISRTIGTDVESVSDALHDALRETTSAYIVSELRASEDFKATLNFAATGQTIFATAHNTSLVDAIRKLMSFSKDPDIPSNRSLLAQRLKAVIHLRVIAFDDNKQATLPSVWINNATGIRNFVCDGLASLLPHTSSSPGNPPGVLGLAWASAQLLQDEEQMRNQVLKKAHAIDLSIR